MELFVLIAYMDRTRKAPELSGHLKRTATLLWHNARTLPAAILLWLALRDLLRSVFEMFDLWRSGELPPMPPPPVRAPSVPPRASSAPQTPRPRLAARAAAPVREAPAPFTRAAPAPRPANRPLADRGVPPHVIPTPPIAPRATPPPPRKPVPSAPPTHVLFVPF